MEFSAKLFSSFFFFDSRLLIIFWILVDCILIGFIESGGHGTIGNWTPTGLIDKEFGTKIGCCIIKVAGIGMTFFSILTCGLDICKTMDSLSSNTCLHLEQTCEFLSCFSNLCSSYLSPLSKISGQSPHENVWPISE